MHNVFFNYMHRFSFSEQYRLNQRDFDIWNRNDIEFGSGDSDSVDDGRTGSHTDDVGNHNGGRNTQRLGDILLLTENDECFNTSYQSVLRHLPQLLITATSRKNLK